MSLGSRVVWKGLWALLLPGFCAAAALDPRVSVSVDAASGSKSWAYQGNGIGLELVQVPPDYIRASYMARGLPPAIIEQVAGRCVFGTIVRNISDQPLSYRVADWRYTNERGQILPIKTKTEWLRQWHTMGVRFSWSILADAPTFAVGDWIQGYTTMAEPHGSRVSLDVVWSIDEKRYHQQFSNLECAAAGGSDE